LHSVDLFCIEIRNFGIHIFRNMRLFFARRRTGKKVGKKFRIEVRMEGRIEGTDTLLILCFVLTGGPSLGNPSLSSPTSKPSRITGIISSRRFEDRKMFVRWALGIRGFIKRV